MNKLEILKLNKRHKTLKTQTILDKKKTARLKMNDQSINDSPRKKNTVSIRNSPGKTKDEKYSETSSISMIDNDLHSNVFQLVKTNNQEGTNKKELLSSMRKQLKDKLKLKYKQKHEIVEVKKEINNEIKEEVHKEMEFKLDEILPNLDNKTYEELFKLGINPNSSPDLESIRSKLSNVFAHDQSEVFNDVKWTNNEKKNFLQFIVNLINLDYKGYDYTIIPERDYFIRQGKLISTILNSEDAAIKKCEELFNQTDSNCEFTDKDFGPQLNDNGP